MAKRRNVATSPEWPFCSKTNHPTEKLSRGAGGHRQSKRTRPDAEITSIVDDKRNASKADKTTKLQCPHPAIPPQKSLIRKTNFATLAKM